MLRPPSRKIYKFGGRIKAMAYTEIKHKNSKRYYYRVKSIKKDKKTQKERIYLGVNLTEEDLKKKEKEADKKLNLFTSVLTNDDLKFLEKVKKSFYREPKENYENRYEHFCSLFTYDSTGIEGNTFTFEETSFLLFEGIVPKDKSLREVYEVLNHKRAFDHILSYKGEINKEFILKLHRLVIANTLRESLVSQMGRYRNVQVFVGRSIPPKPQEVHNLMSSLLRCNQRTKKTSTPLF